MGVSPFVALAGRQRAVSIHLSFSQFLYPFNLGHPLPWDDATILRVSLSPPWKLPQSTSKVVLTSNPMDLTLKINHHLSPFYNSQQ